MNAKDIISQGLVPMLGKVLIEIQHDGHGPDFETFSAIVPKFCLIVNLQMSRALGLVWFAFESRQGPFRMHMIFTKRKESPLIPVEKSNEAQKGLTVLFHGSFPKTAVTKFINRTTDHLMESEPK